MAVTRRHISLESVHPSDMTESFEQSGAKLVGAWGGEHPHPKTWMFLVLLSTTYYTAGISVLVVASVTFVIVHYFWRLN